MKLILRNGRLLASAANRLIVGFANGCGCCGSSGELYIKMKPCGSASEDAEPMWVRSSAVARDIVKVSSYELGGETFEYEIFECFCVKAPLERLTRDAIPFGEKVATNAPGTGDSSLRGGCCECLQERYYQEYLLPGNPLSPPCQYTFYTIEGDPDTRLGECCCKVAEGTLLSATGSFSFTRTSVSNCNLYNETTVINNTITGRIATYSSTSTDYLGNVTTDNLTVDILVGLEQLVGCGIPRQKAIFSSLKSILGGPSGGFLVGDTSNPTVNCIGGSWSGSVNAGGTVEIEGSGGCEVTFTENGSATLTWVVPQAGGECGCEPEEPGDVVVASASGSEKRTIRVPRVPESLAGDPMGLLPE